MTNESSGLTEADRRHLATLAKIEAAKSQPVEPPPPATFHDQIVNQWRASQAEREASDVPSWQRPAKIVPRS